MVPNSLRLAASIAGICVLIAAPVHSQGSAKKAPPPAQEAPKPASGRRSVQNYKFAPGDKVSFRVVESRDEPVELKVSPTGEIEVPLMGKRLVYGKTISQVESELKAEYEKDFYYTATVQIFVESIEELPPEQKPVKTIYVTGQVQQQGAQQIPPGETYTVSRAILRAGGFASFANGRQVKIVRKGQNKEDGSIIVDVLSILEDGKVENDVELKPDDLVIVPEKLINF